MTRTIQRWFLNFIVLIVVVTVVGNLAIGITHWVGGFAGAHPGMLLFVPVFVVGLLARARAGRRDPRRDLQRRQLRRWADDIPAPARRHPGDPDPALPFGMHVRGEDARG